MALYVKKEVEPREARQLTEKNRDELMEWCCGRRGLDGTILLKTPESGEGTQMVVLGDFIMKGYSEEQGWHFWPIKPDYMEANYKKVSETV